MQVQEGCFEKKIIEEWHTGEKDKNWERGVYKKKGHSVMFKTEREPGRRGRFLIIIHSGSCKGTG